MSIIRFILRLFFLCFAGMFTFVLPYRLLFTDVNQFELNRLVDGAIVFGASGIGMLVVLYALEIEKRSDD